MRARNSVRCFTVPLALLALLAVVMLLGSVWHHHEGSSEASCQICHVSHQPVEPLLVTHRAPALALLGPALDLPDTGVSKDPIVRRVLARAPPIA